MTQVQPPEQASVLGLEVRPKLGNGLNFAVNSKGGSLTEKSTSQSKKDRLNGKLPSQKEATL